ncbi:hypothetical protein FRB95_007784 [Tulasnella sp. JGI-2019a]|nr:hypothetical protein FRB95_007784 [Tulasnella sp. JGI-2019a]
MSIKLLGTALSILALIKIYRYVASRGTLPYPPGPPGDFVIGNLRQMPLSYPWLVFTKWAQRYGPINYLNIGGNSILILNTQEVALALLEKKASIYSDRPRFIMASELAGMEHVIIFLRYGALHKKHRKLVAQSLHPRVVERDFVPLQERFTHQLAQALLDDPDHFMDHIDRCAGKTVTTIAYGEDNPDVVEMGRATMKYIAKITTGYVVEFLPWLKYVPEWFPGAQFQKDARLAKEIYEKTRWIPYNTAVEKAEKGTAPASFVLSALEAMKTAKAGEIDANIISSSAFTLIGGGSETSAATLSTFVLAMLLYPDVQARAQAELDRVVGDHLPTIASKDSTPYLNAIINETLRWHPVVPLGLPHSLMQDDVYNEYLIPAGTTILVNVWGILHDEHHFPDPFTLNPERFLPSENAKEISEAPLDPWTVAFGYGRHMCQGIPVAQSGLWIAMATILSCFNIQQKFDPETKKPMVTEPLFSGESISPPLPFACDITPRSTRHADRIRESVSTSL